MLRPEKFSRHWGDPRKCGQPQIWGMLKVKILFDTGLVIVWT